MASAICWIRDEPLPSIPPARPHARRPQRPERETAPGRPGTVRRPELALVQAALRLAERQ